MRNGPDCYKCKWRGEVPGSAHSCCKKSGVRVAADSHGIRNGWFNFPSDFDPVWLGSCDGFESKEEK